jgi:aminomethyltransferase
MDELRRTPLYGEHVALEAKLVPFAGWEMPVSYTSILAECRAVRESAGIFDVSHMGRFCLRGPGALVSVQRAVTNDASKLVAGQCQYSLLLTEQGGIADDLFVYRPGNTDDLMGIVANAANAAKDFAAIEGCLVDATLLDETADTAMIALQGPKARGLAQGIADRDLSVYGLHRYGQCKLAGIETTSSCTGYTGEDGFEIVCAKDDGPALWRALLAAGAAPCGLGARDVLRVEAGYPLWGHEISESTRPADAGVSRFCAKDKGEYLGKSAAEAYAEKRPESVLIGLKASGRRFPRDGAAMLVGGEAVGRVTSGTFSPSLGLGIAIGRVANPERVGYRARIEELLGTVAACGEGAAAVEAEIVGLPFYRRSR